MPRASPLSGLASHARASPPSARAYRSGIASRDAAAAIGALFAGLVARLDRPATLVVTGGETLRGVCDALGANGLDADGEVVPGMPTSLMRGGRWDGMRIVSKSGAFGDADLLSRLLDATV